MKAEDIVKVCHEVNKAYCESMGDHSQPTWGNAPEWQKSSATNGVYFHLENPTAGPDHSHAEWLKEKKAGGWVYGSVKDPIKKEHPCCVPYEQLPVEQKAKDYIFRSVVHALKPFLAVLALFVSACSSGLQERAFKDESGTYIVSRSLVNDRVTANQPHVSGVFACDSKIPVEAMAQWRQLNPGEERSEYSQCQPIEKYRPGAYQLTSDQPIGTIYKGPVEAAILGGSIGAGLALSGDTVIQQGGGANASARVKLGRHHRR